MQTMKVFKSIILLLGIVLFSGCTSKKSEKTNDEIGVKTMAVSPEESCNFLNYVGTVEEQSSTAVSFKVQGNVLNINAVEGEKIGKGKCLATLDSEVLRQSYLAAKATYEQAADAMKRMQLLYDNKSLSEIKYVEVKTKLAQALSTYKIAEKNLSNTKLLSPVSGIVGSKNIEVGENVVPGFTAFTILNIQDVKIKVSVPESEVYLLKDNMIASVKVSALGNKTFEGKIVEKGVVADPITHTYDVKVVLNNSNNELMPGMVCDVNIVPTENVANSSIVIPNNSIQITDNDNHFVWIVKDGKATATNITIGKLTNKGVVIQSGLTTGDKVIVEGMQKVSEGMKVREL